MERIKPAEPKAAYDENEVVFRAARYEEIAGMSGWRDYIGLVESYRKQLEEAVLKGKFGAKRPDGATDDEIRAMLFMTERLLSIPAVVASQYDFVRKQQEARQRMIDKHIMVEED